MLIIVGTFLSPHGEVKFGGCIETLSSATLSCRFSKYEFILRLTLTKLKIPLVSASSSTQFNLPYLPTEINQWYATQNIKHLGFRFDFDRDLGQFCPYDIQQNRQDDRLECAKTKFSCGLPYFIDSVILYGRQSYPRPEGVAPSDIGTKPIMRRNRKGSKGSWQEKIFQPRDQAWLEKISQTMSWMLRHDGESLNRLQGGFLPVDYMLEHVALKNREAKRADLLTILRCGGGNWEMRFKSKVDEQGNLWIAAWGGHSEGFKENDGDMHPNREATSLGHGTEWIHLDSITDVGLPR